MDIVYNLENIICICLLLAMRVKLTSLLDVQDYFDVMKKKFKNFGFKGNNTLFYNISIGILMRIDVIFLYDSILLLFR